ncbi:MAG: DUF4494 domain-containing protein [Flavobacteriaceae bacterium]|nr:DUF4494 domain-containing protein [Flavobacteriaceae bacterium]
MSIWYECKIKYRKTDEQGNNKAITDTYLVDALSFTEAENRTTEIMREYVGEEFKITNISLANFSEICPVENADFWYKCKLSLITFDEEKGVEKKSNSYILVQGNNLKEAYDNLEAYLKGTVSDYEIPSINFSPILEVFPYFDKDDKDQELPSQEAEDNNETTEAVEKSEEDFEKIDNIKEE